MGHAADTAGNVTTRRGIAIMSITSSLKRDQSTPFFKVIAIFFIVTGVGISLLVICLAVLPSLWRLSTPKDKTEPVSTAADPIPTPLASQLLTDDIAFNAACDTFNGFSEAQIKKLSRFNWLQAKALLKQAVEGDCATVAPFVLKFEAREEHAAWMRLKGMNKEKARIELIIVVAALAAEATGSGLSPTSPMPAPAAAVALSPQTEGVIMKRVVPGFVKKHAPKKVLDAGNYLFSFPEAAGSYLLTTPNEPLHEGHIMKHVVPACVKTYVSRLDILLAVPEAVVAHLVTMSKIDPQPEGAIMKHAVPSFVRKRIPDDVLEVGNYILTYPEAAASYFASSLNKFNRPSETVTMKRVVPSIVKRFTPQIGLDVSNYLLSYPESVGIFIISFLSNYSKMDTNLAQLDNLQ